jgi:hypothetical protein
VSVRKHGAKGDGHTDDTKALQAAIDMYHGCKIIYVDHGTYLITDTLRIPPNTIITGEIWPVIMASGDRFSDPHNPQVAVQVGEPDCDGTVEITDIMFSTKGGSAGAIVMEWNARSPHKGGAAMWDSHFRLGGFKGTELQWEQCKNTTNHNPKLKCFSSFLALHLKESASAYLENVWVWTADHDIEDAEQKQISVYSGRGILSESKRGPIWLVGTASEHHTMYQYQFLNSKNIYASIIQTESPYYQPVPAAPKPWKPDHRYHDPKFPKGFKSAWSTLISNSCQVHIYGAGTYSFFQEFSINCVNNSTCQYKINNIDSDSTDIHLYSVATVGTQKMFAVDWKPTIDQASNENGFSSLITQWNSQDTKKGKHAKHHKKRDEVGSNNNQSSKDW